MPRSEFVRFVAALGLLLAAVYTPIVPVARTQSKAEPADYGYHPNPEAVQRFLATLEEPTFRQAGKECLDKARGKDTYLYRAMYRAHQARYGKPFVVGRQLNGSCVAWGWHHGIYVAESVEWDIGNRDEPPLIPSTEGIYGAARVESQKHPCDGKRAYGGWQDGSWGSAAAEAVSKWGILYRKQYPFADLTTYDGKREKDWGAYGQGGENDNCVADEEAKKTPALYVAQVSTFDEAAAAIEAGYPVPVASNQGFEMRRQADGSALPSGVWMHQMCFISVRYAKNGDCDEDQLLVLNSWGGTAHSGPLRPDDQPEGSFWVGRQTCEKMLQQDDSFAVGKIKFAWRDIDHHRFLAPVPGG